MTETTSPGLPSEISAKNPILVAVDFSEDSKAALIWACKLAECTEAPLILLHVVHDLASHPGYYRENATKNLQPMQEVAESMMDEFLSQLRSEHSGFEQLDTADLQFVPGLPPSRIVEVATLLKAGMIVMGSRGLTGLPHKLLGATAERVAELSKLPILLVKSETHGVLGKKDQKLREKRIKKDRKRLRDILGIKTKAHNTSDMNG